MTTKSISLVVASYVFWYLALLFTPSDAFTTFSSRRHVVGEWILSSKQERQKNFITAASRSDGNELSLGSDGRNWIEKSSPTGIGALEESENEGNLEGNYDLGIHGESFQTGSLSKRMYDALMSVAMKRFPPGAAIPSELQDVYSVYAMDMTAKEASQAALQQNGLDLATSVSNDGGDASVQWGQVDTIRILNEKTGEPEDDDVYDSWQDAIEEGDWAPGKPFSFVARNVPAKVKELDVSELLEALDPDGTLREEAKEKGMVMPDEDLSSLKELGRDCERRSKVAPREAETDESVFKGTSSKGYSVIKRSDLLTDSVNFDGTENRATLMHTMDSLVNHGCLIVDVTDGGASFKEASILAKMWDVTGQFFKSIEGVTNLPKMKPAEGVGSKNAVVGFASYGQMQFLETRLRRRQTKNDDNNIVPEILADYVGLNGCKIMEDSFDVMSNIGKDIVRITVAASSIEAEAFLTPTGKLKDEDEEEGVMGDMPFISGLTFEDAELFGVSTGNENDDDEVFVVTEEDRLNAAIHASEAAAFLADEIMDDGYIPQNLEGVVGSINMSPHRICRYSGKKYDDNQNKKAIEEVFGAHTDTSFMTIVPVAATSGLEVFDEDSEKWYRPELKARKTWEQEQMDKGLDPSALFETITDENGEEIQLPWHSRYLIAMPGELMQIVTRDEVPACVHRVVALSNKARLSAPVLLRGRSGMKLDASKYLGNMEVAGPILNQCDGMTMEAIHDELQPSSYRQ